MFKMDNTMMSGMMASMMQDPSQQQQQAPVPAQQQPQQQAQQQQQQRREMQGPGASMGLPGGMDFSMLGGLAGGMGGLGSIPLMGPPQPSKQQQQQQATDFPGFSVPNNTKKAVSFAPGTKRPLIEEINPADEDRMSDVVSDDLASGPDDLTSMGSGEDPVTGTKTIRVTSGGSKKRTKKTQNVITL